MKQPRLLTVVTRQKTRAAIQYRWKKKTNIIDLIKLSVLSCKQFPWSLLNRVRLWSLTNVGWYAQDEKFCLPVVVPKRYRQYRTILKPVHILQKNVNDIAARPVIPRDVAQFLSTAYRVVCARERWVTKSTPLHIPISLIGSFTIFQPVEDPESKGAHDQNRKSRKSEEGGRLDASAMRHRLRTLDRFQICLATCRTSSASVRHENTYKDPHSKHCYSLLIQNVNSNQRYRRDLNNVLNVNNNSEPSRAAIAPSSTVSIFSYV